MEAVANNGSCALTIEGRKDKGMGDRSPWSQEPTEFISISRNLRNQALLHPTNGRIYWYQPSWKVIRE